MLAVYSLFISGVYTYRKNPSVWTLRLHVNCILIIYWLNSLPALKLILSRLVNDGKPVPMEARVLGPHCLLLE